MFFIVSSLLAFTNLYNSFDSSFISSETAVPSKLVYRFSCKTMHGSIKQNSSFSLMPIRSMCTMIICIIFLGCLSSASSMFNTYVVTSFSQTFSRLFRG